MYEERDCSQEVSSLTGFSLEPDDMGLDVKLAFNSLCGLIDSLEPNEDSYLFLKKMEMEARKIIEIKKREMKENLVHNTSQWRQPFQNSSSSNLNVSKMRNQGRDSSFFNKSKKDFHTSLRNVSNFRPISESPDPNDPSSSVQVELMPVPCEGLTSIDSDNDDALSDISSVQDKNEAVYMLRKWSLKKNKTNLYLTGTKLDRKGNLLEEYFVSTKILSRPNSDIVRTQDGDFIIEEPISDPQNKIPEEVKAFFEEEYFPRTWRKVLTHWNEFERKQSVTQQKPKKSTPKENKTAINKLNKSESTQKGKKTPDYKDKETQKKISKSDSGPKSQEKKPRKATPLGGKSDINKNGKKQQTEKDKKMQLENKKKIVHKKGGKNEPATKPKGATKKNESPTELYEDSNDQLELAELGDDSFLLPSSALTPTGLLSSLKKMQIKGRFTPPTNFFDNIYGKSTTPMSNASTVEESFDAAAHKNMNVVKRMAKAKKAPKVPEKQPTISKAQSKQNAIVDEVLKAANTQTVTTPTIIKDVFRNKSPETSDESETEFI